MKMLNTPESWEDFSERLRDRFSKLTADDVAYLEDRDEDTLKRIRERLGWSRQEVIDLLERMKVRQ